MTTEAAALVEPVKAIAIEAGTRIMEVYATDFDVARKDDASPLTAADMASHKAICEGLNDLTPGIPILSEESAGVAYQERRRWRRFWLVDPLDGTKEFVKRNDEFTVNIALIEEHEPILGVVLLPVSGVCYFAAKGQGAFRQSPGAVAQRIQANPLADGPVRVVGSRSHAGDSLKAFLDRLGEYELVAVGSSLKFCRVAEGAADIYPRLGLTSEWDTAAAQCVVEEAGGRVVSVSGERLAYNTRDSLLNPHFLVIADASRDWLAYLPEKP